MCTRGAVRGVLQVGSWRSGSAVMAHRQARRGAAAERSGVEDGQRREKKGRRREGADRWGRRVSRSGENGVRGLGCVGDWAAVSLGRTGMGWSGAN
jgi:hypothetical protein